MTLHIARRGRPPKSASVAPAPVVRPNHEVLEDLKYRFSMLGKLTTGATQSNIRAMVVSGSAGVGKTYTVEHVLEQSGTHYEVVKGTLSALHLFKLGYKYRKRGNVVVLDDADGIFTDEEALNILKAALDTSKKRTIHWNTDSRLLRSEGVPNSFEFKGGAIFITNIKFDNVKSKKLRDHLEALESRCHYLDLTIDTVREKLLRIRQVVTEHGMLDDYGFEDAERNEVVEFIEANKHRMRELSLRMVLKVADLRVSMPTKWQAVAQVTCMRH